MSEKSEKKIAAARAFAEFYIGDPNWADSIINAWKNPEATMEALHSEGYPDDEDD